MNVVCRLIFCLGICILFIGGCAQSRSSSGVDAGQSQEETCKDKQPSLVQKRFPVSLHMSCNLRNDNGLDYEIDQGENVLALIGITDDERPIVEACYEAIFRLSLEVYLNPQTILKGNLFRSQFSDGVWEQTLFTKMKGWERLEQTWKVVSGKAPDKEEWLWEGTYRTDGETLYFDATNKNGSHCTWMLMTKAPCKSRDMF